MTKRPIPVPLAAGVLVAVVVLGGRDVQSFLAVQRLSLLEGCGRQSVQNPPLGLRVGLAPSSSSNIVRFARRSSPEDGPAGSFFHRVPESDDPSASSSSSSSSLGSSSSSSSEGPDDEERAERRDGGGDNDDATNNLDLTGKISGPSDASDVNDANSLQFDDDALTKLLERRRRPPRASRPSTINGIPTERATGFGTSPSNKKPYVAIGPQSPQQQPPIITTTTNNNNNNDMGIVNQPINDPTRPEFDDQGYTLYTDQVTGRKARVFEALVDYPCTFTLKIVGANEGDFVGDILAVVAEACNVIAHPRTLPHSTKAVGKWTSVTVEAPVDSSEMLYALYERVDLDPRVKFKF